MSIKTTYSIKSDIKENAAEIVSVLAPDNPKLILLFSSSKYDLHSLNTEIKNAFPGATVIGSTTAGEIACGKMLKCSVVAMGIGADIIEDMAIGIVEKVNEENRIARVFSGFEKKFGVSMIDMDINKYVGIILIDGLSGAEERIMDSIGNLTDVPFIGGSAGDDLAFTQTFVFAEGKVFTNAAVLAVMKLKRGFDIIKTQSFYPTNKILKATKVNEATRTVHQFNNIPAAVAYAQMLGVTVNQLSEQFMKHPLGLISADGHPFVRSPQQIKENSVVFYCNILEGMELNILDSTDIIADTRRDLENKIKELGSISGVINFNCILRTLELEHKGLTGQYGQIFSSIPTVGFSTYGEEYIGHINQTSTILILK